MHPEGIGRQGGPLSQAQQTHSPSFSTEQVAALSDLSILGLRHVRNNIKEGVNGHEGAHIKALAQAAQCASLSAAVVRHLGFEVSTLVDSSYKDWGAAIREFDLKCLIGSKRATELLKHVVSHAISDPELDGIEELKLQRLMGYRISAMHRALYPVVSLGLVEVEPTKRKISLTRTGRLLFFDGPLRESIEKL